MFWGVQGEKSSEWFTPVVLFFETIVLSELLLISWAMCMCFKKWYFYYLFGSYIQFSNRKYCKLRVAYCMTEVLIHLKFNMVFWYFWIYIEVWENYVVCMMHIDDWLIVFHSIVGLIFFTYTSRCNILENIIMNTSFCRVQRCFSIPPFSVRRYKGTKPAGMQLLFILLVYLLNAYLNASYIMAKL